MKASIETFVAIILIVVATLLSVCYITVAINHHTAQEFHAQVINEIENSDFSSEVIAAQIETAKDLGYFMLDNNGDVTSDVALTIEAPADAVNKKVFKTAKVELVYYYDAGFMNPIKYTLTGYAR